MASMYMMAMNKLMKRFMMKSNN